MLVAAVLLKAISLPDGAVPVKFASAVW
jgi:hypothetical protein